MCQLIDYVILSWLLKSWINSQIRTFVFLWCHYLLDFFFSSFNSSHFTKVENGIKYSTSLAVLLPGKSHGRRSLVGCCPWGLEESDTTERPDFHFSLSCIGEGTGNPLQCSCLGNPRDGGAWLAAVYGVAQSRTRLKRLSSSSSSSITQPTKLITLCGRLKFLHQPPLLNLQLSLKFVIFQIFTEVVEGQFKSIF